MLAALWDGRRSSFGGSSSIGCSAGGWLVGVGVRVGLLVGFVVGSRGTIHRPVLWHFRPVIITFPSKTTLTLVLLNVTSHPALHSVTTDINECEANPGMMCPRRAVIGSPGMFSVHSCVDFTLFPSGRLTVMPSSMRSLLATCAVVIKKLLVAPESRIAHLWILFRVSVIVSNR